MSKTKIFGIIAIILIVVAATFTQTELLKGTLEYGNITEIESQIGDVMQEQEQIKAAIASATAELNSHRSELQKQKDEELNRLEVDLQRELEASSSEEERNEYRSRFEELMAEINEKYEKLDSEAEIQVSSSLNELNQKLEELEAKRKELMEQYAEAEKKLANATPEATPEATPDIMMECVDTDPNDNTQVKGNAKYQSEDLWDYCGEDDKTLYQAQCPSTTIASYNDGTQCEHGCFEGVCKTDSSASATPSATATATPTPSPTANTGIKPDSVSPKCTARLTGTETLITETFKGNGSGGNNYYIWTGGSVDANGGGGNAAYIKSGGSFDANGGGSNTIFYENGAKIVNAGGSAALTLCGEIIFERNGQAVTPPKKTQDTSGSLTISSSASSQTKHVIGSQNVDLFSFTLTAGGGSQVTVNSIGFTAVVSDNEDTSGWSKGVDTDTSSSAVAANILQTITLYDGTTQIGSSESPNSTTGEINFTGTSISIPKNSSKTITAKATLSKNSISGKKNDLVALIFENPKTIDAQDSKGNKVSAKADSAGLNTNAGNWQKSGPNSYITVSNQGKININPPLKQVPSQTLILGAKDVKLAEFTLNAEMENFVLPRISFDGVQGLSNIALKYADENGNEKKHATFVGSNQSRVTFDAINMKVAQGKEMVIGLYGDMPGYFPQSNESGKTIQVIWPKVDNFSLFQAIGETSSRVINKSGAEIKSNPHMTRRSIIKAEFPSKKESIIYGVEADVAKIKLTAGPEKTSNAALYQITFDVKVNGIDTGRITAKNAWKIYNADKNLNTALSHATYNNGKVRFIFDGQNTKSKPLSLDGNGTTFLIRGPILEDLSEITKGVVAISLSQDKGFGKTNTVATVNAQNDTLNNFIWSDMSSPIHALNTTDWSNGYGLGLPKEAMILE